MTGRFNRSVGGPPTIKEGKLYTWDGGVKSIMRDGGAAATAATSTMPPPDLIDAPLQISTTHNAQPPQQLDAASLDPMISSPTLDPLISSPSRRRRTAQVLHGRHLIVDHVSDGAQSEAVVLAGGRVAGVTDDRRRRTLNNTRHVVERAVLRGSERFFFSQDDESVSMDTPQTLRGEGLYLDQTEARFVRKKRGSCRVTPWPWQTPTPRRTRTGRGHGGEHRREGETAVGPRCRWRRTVGAFVTFLKALRHGIMHRIPP